MNSNPVHALLVFFWYTKVYMNPFGLSGLLIGLTGAVLAFFIIGKQQKRRLHMLWLCFTLSVMTWGVGSLFISFSRSENAARVLWQFTHLGVILIPFFFYHFVLSFLEKTSKHTLVLLYIPAIIFLVLNIFSPWFIYSVRYVFNSFYYDSPPSFAYTIFTLFFFSLVGHGHWLLWRAYKKSQGLRRQQIRYFFLATGVGFLGGGLSFLPVFEIDMYPWGNFTVPLYSIIMTYAIFRYRLMNVRFVVSRSIVYTLLVLIVSVAFTTSIFIFSRFLNVQTPLGSFGIVLISSTLIVIGLDPVKRLLSHITQRVFYKDAVDYQKVLRVISDIIAQKLELHELVKGFTQQIENVLQVKQVAVYIISAEGIYHIQKGGEQRGVVPGISHTLIALFKRQAGVVLLEELQQKIYERGDSVSKQKRALMKSMEQLNASIIVPLYSKKVLIGFVTVGSKLSSEVFQDAEIEIFEVLAPQLASAVEKSKLYEEVQQFNDRLETKIEHATEDLRKANEHLQQLDKAKSEFLSIAAHQLRTPLTGIKGYLSMIEAGEIPQDKVKGIIHELFNQTNRLSRVVNVFLNVSRIEAGRLHLEYTQGRIEDVVTEVYGELHGVARKKQISLTIGNAKKKTPQLYFDQDKIHDVIMNLIDNAIKYTNRGGKIGVSLACDDEEIVVCVRDTGIGLSVDDLSTVFEKFSRGVDGFKTNTEGVGLGLFIAKRIVEAHGGRIWVESKGKGRGSAFWVALPFSLKTKPEHAGMQTLVQKELEQSSENG